MEQNGSLLEIEIEASKSEKPNYFLLLKKTLQFLVPVSLLSFLLTYASAFSFIFTCNFHFSSLVLPLLSHVLERKYMFLICNGILAFLYGTLSFNTSPSADEIRSSEENADPATETLALEEAVPLENVAPGGTEEEAEEEAKAAEEENGGGFQSGSSVIIESEDIHSEGAEEEEDYEAGESAASLLGEINMNTEELNHKFEEFIRKMKEEIRIEAQQQLLVV